MATKERSQRRAEAHVEALNHEAKGVARVAGKAVFIDGALPGEDVVFHYTGRKRHFDEGSLDEVLAPSPARVEPRCRHFGLCGGCCLQHLSAEGQLSHKQATVLETLGRVGHVTPEQVLPPVTAAPWGYRRKARLGVRYVHKKGRVLVGFRERRGRYLADLSGCEVLEPAVGRRLQALQALVAGLDAFDHVPQIEIAVGDAAAALVFRHLQPLGEADRGRLRAFGQWYGIAVYLQPGGPDSVRPLWPAAPRLGYRLPAHDVEIIFEPTDFIQVNGVINRRLVDLVIDLLAPRADENALDLFCGVGNFTLPMARRFRQVIGVEGDERLVRRASQNAAHNGITNARFHTWDLAREMTGQPWWPAGIHKVLLDPPRTGAREAIEALASLAPARIVYVSCNPATLARDADLLVNGHGYRLTRAGAVDMFPQTAHMEAIAVFQTSDARCQVSDD